MTVLPGDGVTIGAVRWNGLTAVKQRQLRSLVVDQSFGFEHHYIRGKAKMQVRVGLAMAIMMALALGHVQEGRPEQMRSLVQPVPLLDTG